MAASGPVLYGDPVERGHPLNRGLVSWWLPLPGRGAGRTLFDVAGRNNGTLTNGATWASGPNGNRAVSFDGTDDYVNVGSAIATAGDLTASCWVYPTANPGSFSYKVLFGFYNTTSPFTGWGLARGGPTATPANGLGFWDGTAWRNLGADWTLNAWQHLAVVATSSVATLYVNGVPASSPACSARGSYTGVKTFGSQSNGAAQFLTGAAVDQRIHNRALYASEVRELYQQSRKGYPDLLRRASPRAWRFGVADTPTTGSHTPQRRRRFFTRRTA